MSTAFPHSPLAALRGQPVHVVEVGPRDGLQNEHAHVPTDEKIHFVDQLAASGVSCIEVSAFVSPHRVPQMADAAAVFAGLTRRPGVRYTALVPNLAGLRRALSAGVDEVAIFAAASETFSRKNINQGIDESLVAYAEVCHAARDAGVSVRGYLSTCFGCPFEGAVPAGRVAALASRLMDLGVREVALSDTIGVAHPGQVWEVLAATALVVPTTALALHFHDTRGTALANVLAGLEAGVRTFDAAAGGLGGCPYAPGASGNLATEDLVCLLDGLGMVSGISLAGVLAASVSLQPRIGHPMPSRVLQAAVRSSGE